MRKNVFFPSNPCVFQKIVVTSDICQPIIRSSMCSKWGTPRTRAPHLLLILATGNYSVRLYRFIFA